MVVLLVVLAIVVRSFFVVLTKRVIDAWLAARRR